MKSPDRPLFLDSHSTTPVDPDVLDAMLPFFREDYGNASSRTHHYGWRAQDAVEDARRSVARLIGAQSSKSIIFTSGATESNNLALKGVLEKKLGEGRDHIITQATEHKAVLDPCRHLEEDGVRVTVLPVNREGRVDLDELRSAIDDKTALVSVMLANNEVGCVQPIADIGAHCRSRGVLLHCDAAQGLSYLDVDVDAMGVDLLSLSAHKLYGPKGVGALFVRRTNPRVQLIAQTDGGGHERAMRAGTLNVPGIVGLGRASAIAARDREQDRTRVGRLRDYFLRELKKAGDVEVHGPQGGPWHPANVNLSFRGVDAESLMLALKDDIAISSGAACSSATVEPSYVLRAMGVSPKLAHASLRFGLTKTVSEAELDGAAKRIVAEVRRIRG